MPWHWDIIVRRFDVTLYFIEKYWNKLWNIQELYQKNKNITLHFYRKHRHKYKKYRKQFQEDSICINPVIFQQ